MRTSHRVFKAYKMKLYFLGYVFRFSGITFTGGSINRFKAIRTATTPSITESIDEFLSNINGETIVNAYSLKLTLLNLYKEMRSECGSTFYSHLIIK